MIERIRSKGVTFWAWFFIGSAVLNFYNPSKGGLGLVVCGLITSSVLLILGVNVLRLKEWSRRGVIYYHILTPIVVLFLLPKLLIPHSMSRNAFILLESFIVAFSLIVIYFFTRPAVKDQFKESSGQSKIKQSFLGILVPVCVIGILLFLNLFGGQKEPEGHAIDYGIYKILDKGTMVKNPLVPGGQEWEKCKMELVSTTDKIPLKKGLTFGANVMLTGFKGQSFVTFQSTVHHPPMHKPDGLTSTGFTTSRKLGCFSGLCVDGAQYEFTDDYEMVPGKWTFEYSYNGKILFSKTFEVYKITKTDREQENKRTVIER